MGIKFKNALLLRTSRESLTDQNIRGGKLWPGAGCKEEEEARCLKDESRGNLRESGKKRRKSVELTVTLDSQAKTPEVNSLSFPAFLSSPPLYHFLSLPSLPPSKVPLLGMGPWPFPESLFKG